MKKNLSYEETVYLFTSGDGRQRDCGEYSDQLCTLAHQSNQQSVSRCSQRLPIQNLISVHLAVNPNVVEVSVQCDKMCNELVLVL